MRVLGRSGAGAKRAHQYDIVRKRRGITADTAMRLARYFGGDAQSWLNLQTLYDLRVAEKANARKIDREVTPIASDAA